jgi:hypothetical protein
MKATLSQLCTFYFTPLIPTDDGTKKNTEWGRNNCSKAKLKSGGWTNLSNHARSCVGATFVTDFESLHCKGKPSSITSFVIRIDEAERDMFKWVEWIVMTNQPLSIVDCPMTREAI